MRYLITFSCYGQHLHGNSSGSVDPLHNLPGSPSLEDNAELASAEFRDMTQEAYLLDHASRAVVLEAIRTVCLRRGWSLLAAHVRTTHVHVVLEAVVLPERIMIDLKSYGSRGLNGLGRDGPDRKRWARHGSTRWLWKDLDVHNAIRYVVEQQGEPMEVFVSDEV